MLWNMGEKVNRSLNKCVLTIFKKIISIPLIKRALTDIELRNRNETYFTDIYRHESMLADKIRIESYYNAINKYVKEGDVVIDLGTGTGILSFFAHQKNPKIIYSIDHSKIIEIAKIVAKYNNISKILFINTYSQNFSPAEKADVIIQEQMGSFLFNENMIGSVLDLRNRSLKKGGKILPSQFDLFIEPVEIEDDNRIPLIWEQNIHGINFQCLNEIKNQLENNHFTRYIRPRDIGRFLCIPEPILSFNLETLSSAADLPSTLTSKKRININGRLDGFCVYFRAIFDKEIILEVNPLNQESNHSSWSAAFFRVESVNLEGNDLIEYTFNLNDLNNIDTWNWRYEIYPAFQIQ